MRYELRSLRTALFTLFGVALFLFPLALGLSIASESFGYVIGWTVVISVLGPIYAFILRSVYYVMIHESHLQVREERRGTGRVPYETIERIKLDAPGRKVRLGYHLPLWNGRLTSYTVDYDFVPVDPEKVVDEIERRADAAKADRQGVESD